MANVQIRPARVEDAAAACVVVRRSITELCVADHNNESTAIEGWLANKTTENVAAWISNPRNIIYVAETEGGIAGIAAMTNDGMIILNYVSPDARFNGVSKALLGQLERNALGLGLSRCRLESTKTALAFYNAAGYREEPDATGSACGLECRRMVKILSVRSTNGLHES